MSEWKVDPDNRRRLLQLQKIGSNKRCVDCNAPNPQWASPKFGIFICLECAGTHRSLGVHISFVRSITMDQFKQEELVRMEKGGNEPFVEYMTSHGIDMTLPHKFKYDNPIAQDYKEKLTCEVEGKEFVEPEHPDFDPKSLGKETTPVPAAASITSGSSRQNTPIESRRTGIPQQKEKNEQYFAELGKKNQEKPADLPPSKGGKYQGFGNTPVASNQSSGANSNTMSLENIQTDPVGTLSRGWGLFSSAVQKSFEDVNETYIKPSVQQWNTGELSEETKRAAAQFGQKFQETSTYGMQAFSSFTKNIQKQYITGEEDSYSQANYSKVPSNNGTSSLNNSKENLLGKEKKAPQAGEDEWEEF
ncbi:ADP-ribosylation factor GTPase-activating protein GCS1 [Nakaseomyces bracarensis]|uniref:ADP-ribosylation factor GTPase-activating protein GCS1 n=1 Tax=Nakaseomyces bracarensis TaxID=273131 RepID=A0ABR4NN75_9SACH